ncbi:unnamed protein product, partial [Polarella glacialis]
DGGSPNQSGDSGGDYGASPSRQRPASQPPSQGARFAPAARSANTNKPAAAEAAPAMAPVAQLAPDRQQPGARLGLPPGSAPGRPSAPGATRPPMPPTAMPQGQSQPPRVLPQAPQTGGVPHVRRAASEGPLLGRRPGAPAQPSVGRGLPQNPRGRYDIIGNRWIEA